MYATALAWAPSSVAQKSPFFLPTANRRIAFSLRLFDRLHRLIEPGIHHRMLLFQPVKETVYDWFGSFVFVFFSLFKDIPMFLAVSFVHKQFITLLDCLHGGNTQVILLSLWDGIHEISPDTSPATAASDIFQVVITLISICFQISAAVSFQESFDMVFCPGLRISDLLFVWKICAPYL